jgi:hypothetical protein
MDIPFGNQTWQWGIFELNGGFNICFDGKIE